MQSSLGVPLADDLGSGMHVTISSEIAESTSTTMIQSNGFSMIGMKKSQIEDLGHPYSDCTDEILDRGIEILNLYTLCIVEITPKSAMRNVKYYHVQFLKIE